MPKVKQTTSTDTKSAGAKAADAAKEAARLKVVEASASKVTPLLTAHLDASKKVKDIMFKIFEVTKAETVKHSFDKTETSKMLTAALAKVYCEGDESAVSSNMTANTLKSKFVRLCHPTDAKAQKELDKGLAKGVDFNDALLLARGKKTAAEVNKKGKKGGAREKGGNAIEDKETFGNFIAAIVSRALDGGTDHPKFVGGLTLEEMEESFAEVIAGYRTKLEGDEPETDETE